MHLFICFFVMDFVRKRLLASYMLTLYHTIPSFDNKEKQAFSNIVRKGRNAGYRNQTDGKYLKNREEKYYLLMHINFEKE